jgi:hypothetical protein
MLGVGGCNYDASTMSFETSFDTKQPKLGPKLVSRKQGAAAIPAVGAIPSVGVIPAVAGFSAVACVPSVAGITAVAGLGHYVRMLRWHLTRRLLCCCWNPKVRRRPCCYSREPTLLSLLLHAYLQLLQAV